MPNFTYRTSNPYDFVWVGTLSADWNNSVEAKLRAAEAAAAPGGGTASAVASPEPQRLKLCAESLRKLGVENAKLQEELAKEQGATVMWQNRFRTMSAFVAERGLTDEAKAIPCAENGDH